MEPKATRAECTKCPYREQPFVASDGPRKTERAIVGMAPHTQEIKAGRPFVGPSGKMLDAALQDAGLERKSLLVTNTVLCAPLRGTEPEPEAVECCLPRLRHEIASRGVKYVLTMGRQPREVVLPLSVGAKVVDYQGVWHDSVGTLVLSTYHPAHALRGNEDAFVDILRDVRKFSVAPEAVSDTKYVVLQTHREVKHVVDVLMELPEPACLDLETTHIDMQESRVREWWNGYILCVGVSWKPGQAIVIPEKLFNSRKTLKLLRPALEREQGWFGHNLKFDVLYLMRYFGGDLRITFADDTILLHHLLDERKGTHGLKILAGVYFDHPSYDDEIHEYLERPKVESYAKAPRALLYKYVATDADYTVRLRQRLEPEVRAEGAYDTLYKRVLVPAAHTLARIERRGWLLNDVRLSAVRTETSQNTERLRERVRELAERPELNPNSPKQVAEVLYDDLGFRTPRGRKIKPRSTNAAVLEQLKGRHPFVDTLREYRRWAKLHSTYTTKLEQYCDPERRMHFEFNLVGTVTGRLEAGLALTIPRAYTPEGKLIRQCFVATPGFVIVSADYGQSELCWLGWYSQDAFLFDVYTHGRDLHTEAATELYGKDYTKEDRMRTKMLNFSFAYGGTEYSFAEDSGLPIAEARAIVREYNRLMSGANEWKDELVRAIKDQGWIRSAFGRRRRWPLVTAQNIHTIKTQGVNFPPSSASSDATLWALTLVDEACRTAGVDAYPLHFMHDGIYFEVRDDPELIRWVGTQMRSTMLQVASTAMATATATWDEFAYLEPIPFKVDVEVGPSWGELTPLELA